MTQQTAQRLSELRRAKGLSQEELAEKLNVSRQAISKWERGESSPDTDNLIELAKLYGVSLDDLVFGEDTASAETAPEDPQNGETETEQTPVTEDFSSEKNKKGSTRRLGEILYSVSALVITCAYLLLGFLLPDGQGWAQYWFLFILIPVIGSIGDVIRTKKAVVFNYTCLVVAVFCAIGMIAGVWHPTWILFITIPIFHTVAATIQNKQDKKG
ncbi:MAG: helix-turn-helix domain-containing protein [Clostridia bacterium]|nr:helix-turn-helix domain-containing protein [Clostridia bacterium]